MSRIFGFVTTRASHRYTGHALRSLFECTPIGVGDRVIVIDNDGAGAASDSPPGVDTVTHPYPRSFAQNGNLLIREAAKNGDDLFFCNNDVIFTAGWLTPLHRDRSAVMTPTSNQNYSYDRDGLSLKPVMELDDYLGNEEAFNRLAEEHVSVHHDQIAIAFKTNFFLVRLTREVYESVGLFDERFSPAGGEDDDYSIRAHLLGSSVLVPQDSFVLHFGGRSSWAGPESRREWSDRELAFRNVFAEKWGARLARMFLARDPSIVDGDTELSALRSEGRIGALIERIMQLDGKAMPAELRIPL